jgi:hypothetical protein
VSILELGIPIPRKTIMDFTQVLGSFSSDEIKRVSAWAEVFGTVDGCKILHHQKDG